MLTFAAEEMKVSVDGQEETPLTATGNVTTITTTSKPSRKRREKEECAAAATAMHSNGMYVHAGSEASLIIAPWKRRSTAFKLGKKRGERKFYPFIRKVEIEKFLLTRFNHSESPLLHWIMGPCKDDNGTPFYAVEGNIIQWQSARERGLFEVMAWCQRLSIALQIDAAMDWLDQEGLEYDAYNWDDRTGGSGERQTGISIDGKFKFLDAEFVMQNDTRHWNMLRKKAFKTFAKKKGTLNRLRESDFAHGTPRMRRSIAKSLLQTLLGSQVWECSDDARKTASCERDWYTLHEWADKQAELPYNATLGKSSKSLASALKSAGAGISMLESSENYFASCMASSKDSQRALLSNAYMEEVAKGSRTPPDMEKY